ncbi:hypothetical protein PC129_g2624 [Phytophthora cactorum]|uniref:Uncharacterized protein n=2 Tax=Phytophthora cactorum TaxID=29920 RepID=A0A8T1EM52_9STRA|nr:hypothetical protein PC111_g3580 [Phytophthora cactorum]KAG2928588.1 hypothetical protein PC114_g3069 [Phytophthora cactorum]KAG2954404.1 hypothetical protein PC117_g1259 [Phytophthora cactorum]KAG3041392.1 hypothetical protein PC119_g770 [Phytophthora cactorum]KAG3189144.1 hypothetical protein C6341_g2379 [Phytophthora cactorum]
MMCSPCKPAPEDLQTHEVLSHLPNRVNPASFKLTGRQRSDRILIWGSAIERSPADCSADTLYHTASATCSSKMHDGEGGKIERARKRGRRPPQRRRCDNYLYLCVCTSIPTGFLYPELADEKLRYDVAE